MSNYSPQIIEHFSNPRNLGQLPSADIVVEVRSPVCGDQIHLFARVTDDRIAASSFLAYGCAAAIGTASILTETIQDRIVEELAVGPDWIDGTVRFSLGQGTTFEEIEYTLAAVMRAVQRLRAMSPLKYSA